MGLLDIFSHITGIGDSLMSGEHVTDNMDYLDNYDYAWLTYLCRRTGAKCTIYSRGGLTTKSWLDIYGFEVCKNTDKCPCYFIALGTNDFNCQIPVGSLDDKIGAETYIGYYKQILETIKGNNPYAICFLCSQYWDENTKQENGKYSAKDYNDAVRAIADIYENCFYLDYINNHEAILGEPEITLNGHYNTIGYYKASLAFEKCANKIIEENIEAFKKIGLFNSFGTLYDHIKKNF